MSDTPWSPIQDRIASMVHAFDDDVRKHAVRLLANDVGQLESELNAANERIKQLEEEVSDLKGINAAMTMDAAMYEDRGARIKQLEAVVNNPEALWTNWLRGTVKLPEGIGDVRQYQDRIRVLEEAAKVTSEQIHLMAELHSRRTLDERKRVVELEDAIRKTLDENRHLADGDDCTLHTLKKALPEWT